MLSDSPSLASMASTSPCISGGASRGTSGSGSPVTFRLLTGLKLFLLAGCATSIEGVQPTPQSVLFLEWPSLVLLSQPAFDEPPHWNRNSRAKPDRQIVHETPPTNRPPDFYPEPPRSARAPRHNGDAGLQPGSPSQQRRRGKRFSRLVQKAYKRACRLLPVGSKNRSRVQPCGSRRHLQAPIL